MSEYVILKYDLTGVELDVEAVFKFDEDYDILNWKLIDKPAVILHKEFIHMITIYKDLDIVPTKSLKLSISNSCRQNNGGVIRYLENHNLNWL